MGLFDGLKEKIKEINNKNIIGLDIGEETIKLTEVSVDWGRIFLNNVAIIDVPEGAVIDGKLEKLDPLEKVIKETLDEKEFQAKRVVAAISGEQVVSRIVSIPSMSEEDLQEAINWEAKDKLPIDVGQAVIDYEILEEKEDGGYQILIIAVDRELINRHLRLLERLKLQPVAIEIESLAIARTIGKLYMNKTIGVIDIGSKTTDISILNENNLLFTRTIGVGGDNITLDISELNHSTIQEAEEYKKTTNLFKGDDKSLIVRNLTTSIYRSLDYFQVKYKDIDIDKIVLTGGGSKLIGFDRYLTKEFGVRVEKMNLSNRLRSEVVTEDYLSEAAQFLGVSIGLALREEGE